jgi:hypothetical protein
MLAVLALDRALLVVGPQTRDAQGALAATGVDQPAHPQLPLLVALLYRDRSVPNRPARFTVLERSSR